MADSANVLIAAAQALGYDSLSTRAVKECLLYAADTNGGGGGGGNSITQGHGDPVNPPTDITLASIYVDLDTGTFWSWRVVDQAWF